MVDENRPGTGQPASPAEPDGHSPGGLQHPTVRYEHSDAGFRWIFGLLVVAAVFLVITGYAIRAFFYVYRDREAAVKSSHFPLAASESRSLPPEPRLEQINRMAEIEKGNVRLRYEQKEAVLNSYGPAGEKYVHIPIDRAMDVLANRLPARTAQPPAAQLRRQNGLVGAGESNSGRMFRGPSDD